MSWIQSHLQQVIGIVIMLLALQVIIWPRHLLENNRWGWLKNMGNIIEKKRPKTPEEEDKAMGTLTAVLRLYGFIFLLIGLVLIIV